MLTGRPSRRRPGLSTPPAIDATPSRADEDTFAVAWYPNVNAHRAFPALLLTLTFSYVGSDDRCATARCARYSDPHRSRADRRSRRGTGAHHGGRAVRVGPALVHRGGHRRRQAHPALGAGP